MTSSPHDSFAAFLNGRLDQKTSPTEDPDQGRPAETIKQAADPSAEFADFLNQAMNKKTTGGTE